MTQPTTGAQSALEQLAVSQVASERTRELYLGIATRRLIELARDEGIEGRPLADRLQVLPGWLERRKPSWSKPQFRQVKAALICWLSTLSESAAHETIGALKAISQAGCKPREPRHLKKLDAGTKAALRVELENQGGWKRRAWLFLNAGEITGLRPVEWQGSTYNPVSRLLNVPNAKYSNGRAGNPYRTLHMDTDEAHQSVMEHIQAFREMLAHGYTWRYYQTRCSESITKAARRIWPRRSRQPSLYSARHQFAADNKRAQRPLEEIAVLMGHASANTARAMYGRTTAGYKPPQVSLTVPQSEGPQPPPHRGRPLA